VVLLAAPLFHEAFYATAAGVIPVLLLTLVFQLRLDERDDDEELGLSLFLMGATLSMAIGELSSFVALAEHKDLPKYGDILIWMGLTWGVMMIAIRPIGGRWDALHNAMPLGLSLTIRYGLLLTFLTIVFLVEFGVVREAAIGALGAAVVLLLVVGGMIVTDVGDWRKRRRTQ
jgi:hypothetical protein